MDSFKKFVLIATLPSLVFLIGLSSCSSEEEPETEVRYKWENVQIVGGGFVTGIVFHPTEPNVRYCRTDMGGAYRWNQNHEKWEPLLDWLSYEDVNLMGVESIALDPSDPTKLYLACGTYALPHVSDGAILRSSNRGKSFERINVPFKMGANENGRGNGERLAVDPNNSKIIYLGTRNNGLWKSTNRGISWSQDKGFPNVKDSVPESIKEDSDLREWFWMHKGSGIFSVILDPESGQPGKGSMVIYVAVSAKGGDNLYHSIDGGLSWNPVVGHPRNFKPTDMVLSPKGYLYITYGTNPGPGRMDNGAVWRYEIKTKNWKNITPQKPDPRKKTGFGYAAVAVDQQNPNTLLVSTYHRYGNLGGDDIFRSNDAGKTWKPVFGSGGKIDYSNAPYTAKAGIHWLFDIEIDPFNSDHALFTTGYGGHETFNLTDMDKGKATHWNVMSTGIEETVALELLSPPTGAPLISAIGDYGGFVHWDLDKPAPDGNYTNPHFGNTDGVSCAWLIPELLVRVGVSSSQQPNRHNIGFSTNSGKTWQPTNAMPTSTSKHGHIAVSANGDSWIWTPQNQTPYVTYNNGETWSKCIDLPKNIRTIADKVNPNVFYAIELFEGKFYISYDAGKTFKSLPLNLPDSIPSSREKRGDNRGGQDRLYSTPGKEGNIWLAAFHGLYHSTNHGTTFEKLKGVEEMHAFGFGKPPTLSKYPTLFMIGIVNGQRGIFRSTNKAKTWEQINDQKHQWGLLLHITGDPKEYGRVYIGTHGRGIIYGDPASIYE